MIMLIIIQLFFSFIYTVCITEVLPDSNTVPTWWKVLTVLVLTPIIWWFNVTLFLVGTHRFLMESL
jgi:hypothetical protein